MKKSLPRARPLINPDGSYHNPRYVKTEMAWIQYPEFRTPPTYAPDRPPPPPSAHRHKDTVPPFVPRTSRFPHCLACTRIFHSSTGSTGIVEHRVLDRCDSLIRYQNRLNFWWTGEIGFKGIRRGTWKTLVSRVVYKRIVDYYAGKCVVCKKYCLKRGGNNNIRDTR